MSAPASEHRPIHRLFAEAARRFPERAAVDVAGGETTSYRRLDAAAAAVAAELRAGGVERSEPVGVIATGSVEVIAALLGCWRAGAAAVPVDPTFHVVGPREVFAAARPRRWLAGTGWEAEAAAAGGGEVLPLGELCRRPASAAEPTGGVELGPDDRCYVYFTSGSTGRPKGIEGRYKALDHYVRWMTEELGLGPGVRSSQLISPAWDGFLLDAFVPLSVGGTVCVPDGRETILDGRRLAEWIHRHDVHLVHCTPSLFRTLFQRDLSPADFPGLRHALLVGEVLPPSDVRRWHGVFGERVQLVNLYGPSETTLTKLFHRVRPADGEAASVPIGRPMPGARAIVLDDLGRPCPPGRAGEIYLRTPYRSLGYLGQPELTADVFVPNPLGDRADDVVYRTGDLGRLREDGLLEFVGRRDEQVKLRGVRFELEPVEEALREHPAVADAAVVVGGDGERAGTLCAFVVLRREVSPGELGALVARRLAALQVPSVFLAVDGLPRTMTGKIDRRALAAQATSATPLVDRYVAPRTDEERLVGEVFTRLLAVPRVGVHDDFFRLGGHSLVAMRLLAELERETGAVVELRELFAGGTVEELAALLGRRRSVNGGGGEAAGAAPAELLRCAEGAVAPLSFAQRRLWFLEKLAAASSSFNIPYAIRIGGPLDPGRLAAALGAAVQRQEALRTVFAEREGEPVQVVLPPASPAVPLVDLGALSAERRAAAARRAAAHCARRAFDLGRGPLFGATLLRLGAGEHVFVLVVHHLVADGRSLRLLLAEISAAYAALAAGRRPEASALPVRYRDFAVWQRRRLHGERLEGLLAHWRGALAGVAPFLPLPTDRPRPEPPGFRGGRVPVAVTADVVERLARLASEVGATLYVGVLAAYQVLLHHLTGAADVVVSSPVEDREPGTEEVVGFFVNTLLLRGDISGDPTFVELVARARQTVAGALAHRHLPLEQVVETAAPPRARGHFPLLQVSLNFLSGGDDLPAWPPGITVRDFPFESGQAQFELNLVLAPTAAGLRGELQYRSDLFDRATAVTLGAEFAHLMGVIAANGDTTLGALRDELRAWEGRRRREAGSRLEAAARESLRRIRRRSEPAPAVAGAATSSRST